MRGGRGHHALFLLLRVEAVMHRVQRVLEREDAEEEGERHDQRAARAPPQGPRDKRQRGGQCGK